MLKKGDNGFLLANPDEEFLRYEVLSVFSRFEINYMTLTEHYGTIIKTAYLIDAEK